MSLKHLLLAALTAVLLPAQTFQGQISGVVHDNSGGVIPKVQLTAVDSNSGAKYNAATNESEVYRFPSMLPSQDNRSVTLPAIKNISKATITRQANKKYR